MADFNLACAALVVERPQDGIFGRGWLDRANARDRSFRELTAAR